MSHLDMNYGNFDFDEDGDPIPTSLRTPVPAAAAIPPVQGLLISNGFKCQCCNVYYSVNERVMRRHVKKCATAKAKDPEFCTCFVQTLRQGPGCRYFSVHSAAISSADLDSAMGSLLETHEGFTVADMDAEDPDDENYRDLNAFRVRMQWDTLIEAMGAKKAVEAAKFPSANDKPQLLKLAKLVRLWVSFLYGQLTLANSSCRKLLKQHNPYDCADWCFVTLVLTKFANLKCSAKATDPLRVKDDETTRHRYANTLVRLVCFVWRSAMEQEQFPDVCPVLPEQVRLVLGELQPLLDAFPTVEGILTVDFKKVLVPEEVTEFYDQNLALFETLQRFCALLVCWEQAEDVNSSDCPILRYCIALSLNSKGEVSHAKDVSPAMAGVQYALRLVVFSESLARNLQFADE